MSSRSRSAIPSETHKYGIVGKGESLDGGFRITSMVEKPTPETAPSNFYISGRYILQPEIFELLERQERGAGNEIQLTDAMVRLAETQAFHAHPYDGRTFDCGSKQGFIEATVAFALARDDIRRQRPRRAEASCWLRTRKPGRRPDRNQGRRRGRGPRPSSDATA